MAGLLTPKEMPPREAMPDEAGGPEATPEEQQQYQELFENGWRLIADEQGKPRPGILEYLDPDPSDIAKELGEEAMAEIGENFDPAAALGSTVAVICLRLATSMKEKGVALLPDAMFEAGQDLLKDLAELGEKNGLGPYDDNALARAVTVAAGTYGVQARAQGLISEEEVGQAVSDLKAADESGQLQQMVGGGQQPEAEPQEAM